MICTCIFVVQNYQQTLISPVKITAASIKGKSALLPERSQCLQEVKRETLFALVK